MTQAFLLVNFFFNDGSQNFLTFQPGPTETMVAWQSKGLSNENRPLNTAKYNLSPKLKWHNSKTRVEFTEEV